MTQVDQQDVCTGTELLLRPLGPNEVEVGVQRVHKSTTHDHPVLSVQVEGLSDVQQQWLTELLQQWTSVFAADDKDFGDTEAVLHHVLAGDVPPIRQRYRPVPSTLFPELRALLQGMLDSGVVQESASPWVSAVVLVKKKDGSWCFCVDYRKLNSITHKDAFPLPRIEESLTALRAAAWYSTLDMASGYWQVAVDPNDQEKTAFTTPVGLFQFTRMPFGLRNAPATFQRLMQRCLGG